MKRFYCQGESFYLNGQTFRIWSGSIHYFRLVKESWKDRLMKLKECGLNTVETYLPWNVHEPKQGEYYFEGGADFRRFFEMAKEMGLYVIVRPGPYICAEWEGGGLPAWILREENVHIRCSDSRYMEIVENYLREICRQIKPYLIENGGNILMVQVENEYGSFGNDKEYLYALKNIYDKFIPEALLCTSDGALESLLDSGSIDGVPAFVNFGSKPEENLAVLQRFRSDQPSLCMEFWCGWFDCWGEIHHTRESEDKVRCIEEILRLGASFNIYMFAGGTNFAFMNGAGIHEGKYCPVTTSYDYDAFLTESGDRTTAYYLLRDLLAKYKAPVALMAKDSKKKAYGKVVFSESAKLFIQKDFGRCICSVVPLSMEEMGQAYGYLCYTAKLTYGGKLSVAGLADRAYVFVDKHFAGILDRNGSDCIDLFEVKKGAVLDILTENRGRIGYGSKTLDKKGIEKIGVGWQRLFHFTCTSLPMDDLSPLVFTQLEKTEEPCFYKGKFVVDDLCDTYLHPYGFTSGFAVINGFNLGRYDNTEKPQRTLYVPQSILRHGENEVILFNVGGEAIPEAEFVDKPMYC